MKTKEKDKKVTEEEATCTCNDDECTCGDNCHCGEEEILILKNSIANLEEKVRLAQAELINYRKRKDEEVSSILKYADQDIILELLPIIDNFERAIKLANNLDENSKKFLDGFKILYQALNDILVKFGVVVIDPIGEVFDSTYHNALLIGEDKDKPDDTILEVLTKGYMLKDRVIRTAAVKVNKLN